MPATALLTTGLTGGIPVNPYAFALAALQPLAWLEGGLSAGQMVERMTGRRWNPIDTPPTIANVNGRKVVQFAGVGGLKAADGGDTFVSAATYSLVTVIRFTDATTGGGAVAATDMVSNSALNYVSGTDGSDGFFARNPDGNSLIAEPTDVTDGTFHTTIFSISPGDNVMRRNGAQVAHNSLSMALAGGSGSKRLLVGTGRGSTAYDLLRLNGAQLAGIFVFGKALHADAQALATVEAYCAAMRADLNA